MNSNLGWLFGKKNSSIQTFPPMVFIYIVILLLIVVVGALHIHVSSIILYLHIRGHMCPVIY